MSKHKSKTQQADTPAYLLQVSSDTGREPSKKSLKKLARTFLKVMPKAAVLVLPSTVGVSRLD